MRVPHLHRRAVRFVERNTALYALLGLVSFSRRFESAMMRITAAVGGDAPGVRRPDGEPSRSVLLLLGALALGRRLRAELSSWEPASDPFAEEPSASTVAPFLLPRSLLK
jgi:hypothetical protein